MARLPSLLDPQLAFGVGGGADHTRPHSEDALRLGLRLGAHGVLTRAWRAADGTIVLNAGASVGGRLRRRRIDRLSAPDLPGDALLLAQVYELLGAAGHLALEVVDPGAVPEVIASARDRGDAEARLWLFHGDLDALAGWRALSDSARLVHVTRLDRLDAGPERHAATLRERGIDAAALHESDWSGGTIALYHRFGRLAVAMDAQHERIVRQLAHAGIDAVVTDYVDRAVDALRSTSE